MNWKDILIESIFMALLSMLPVFYMIVGIVNEYPIALFLFRNPLMAWLVLALWIMICPIIYLIIIRDKS